MGCTEPRMGCTEPRMGCTDPWIDSTDTAVRALCASLPNVTFLQDEAYQDADFVVFGCTLWTVIAEEERDVAVRRVKDFRRIPGMDAARREELHRVSRAALRQALEAHGSDPRPFVVLSHHVPLADLTPEQFSGCEYNSAYACDVPEALDPRIAAWVFGHTHCRVDAGRFRSRPVGYPGEIPGAPRLNDTVSLLLSARGT